MESEEVLILSVENSAECLCLGKRKVDKGKCAADPGKRRLKKTSRGSRARDSCLVIVDEGSGSEDDYIEVYGGKNDKDCLAHVDSAGDDKDVLECVVSGPKELRLNTMIGLHEQPVGKVNEVKAKRNKLPCPISSPSSGSTKIPVPITPPDSTDYGLLPESNEGYMSTSSRPVQPVAAAPETSINKADTSKSTISSCHLGAQLHRTPTCWTNCPNCPPNKKRKYHLIDVAYNCPEWGVVSNPLTEAGFTVNRVQRVQNESLWERLCYEKQLMLRDRQNVNEQLLYHTSRSSIPVICEEGLDVRLSRNGMFGSGIYFSDSPVKCNCYWGAGVSGVSVTRYMFCCRVLLGEIKTYPKGKSEQLRREPSKPNPKPGEPKFYDSVMGNLSGQNEFVVYNAYRVMPEYVLQYSLTLPAVPAAAAAMPTAPLSHPSLYNNSALQLQIARGLVPYRKRGRKRGGSRKK